MSSENPFAPRPYATGFGGGPSFGKGYPTSSFQYPGMGMTSAPRPSPMRVFESQVIDLRENQYDEHGRFLPLHATDPNQFEVTCFATSNPGLRDLCKKEKVIPMFLKAHSEWDISQQRAQEMASLIPLHTDDETWHRYIVGVNAVLETLHLNRVETVSEMMQRRRSTSPTVQPVHARSSAPFSSSTAGLSQRLFEEDDDQLMGSQSCQMPGNYLGYHIEHEVDGQQISGQIIGVSQEDGIFIACIQWQGGAQHHHAWEEVLKMKIKKPERAFGSSPNPRPKRRARTGLSASEEWANIVANQDAMM